MLSPLLLNQLLISGLKLSRDLLGAFLNPSVADLIEVMPLFDVAHANEYRVFRLTLLLFHLFEKFRIEHFECRSAVSANWLVRSCTRRATLVLLSEAPLLGLIELEAD